MSQIADKAREAVERGEADEPAPDAPEPAEEPETPLEPAPEPEPEPPAPAPTPEDLEKRFKQLDNEHQRHEKRVREILGADFETLTACPLCWTDGFALAVPIDQRPPEQVQAVKAVLGELAEPEYNASPRHVTCQTCDGWGLVLSGAKNPSSRTVSCPTCMGIGYIDREGQAVTPAPGAAAAPVANGGDPLVEQLRARGFTVIEPYVPPTGA